MWGIGPILSRRHGTRPVLVCAVIAAGALGWPGPAPAVAHARMPAHTRAHAPARTLPHAARRVPVRAHAKGAHAKARTPGEAQRHAQKRQHVQARERTAQQTASAPRRGEAQPAPETVAAGTAEAALPLPLPQEDAVRIRRILALQDAGKLQDAATEIARLHDTLLRGDILAAQYLAPGYLAPGAHPDVRELWRWLTDYPDLPEAPAVKTRLRGLVPPRTQLPEIRGVATLAPATTSLRIPEETDPAADLPQRNRELDREIRDRLRAGDTHSALELIRRTKGLTPLYGAALRAEVAQALFWEHKDREALAVAEDALRGSHDAIGTAGFAGGLAAWRLHDRRTAARLFAAAADAAYTAPALRAGAAFWAARAEAGDRAAQDVWLHRAAASPLTFYGMLARQRLGQAQDVPDRRTAEALGAADIRAAAAIPEGRRAFAFLQVGQKARAEAELRRCWGAVRADPFLLRALRLVARRAGMADLAAQLATLQQALDGPPPEDDRFPLPRLQPRGGFRVDPALVYGLARLESNFDAAAVSSAGARGLMQLMPATARELVRRTAADAALPRSLKEPGANLQAGQIYLERLAGQDSVKGNLIRLLAAYNAGAATVLGWDDPKQAADDPLLYIESIPLRQTRAYVRRALLYSWVYAARLHLPALSLTQLARGDWPSFTPLPQPRMSATLLVEDRPVHAAADEHIASLR